MEIEIKGLDELRDQMKAKGEKMRPELRKATDRAIKFVHGKVPGYPAAIQGSRYRRTGTLGRSITTTVKTIGSDEVGVIGTKVIYAPWVISEEAVGEIGPQTLVHKGRWYTLQGVVRDAIEDVRKIFQDAVDALLKI